MGNTLSSYLLEDHARLDALLLKSVADPAHFDHEAFESFRSGLLRHIGIEEKLLLPAARKQNGGKPLALAHALHVEHAALASLMVPTPDAALVDEKRDILLLAIAPARYSSGLAWLNLASGELRAAEIDGEANDQKPRKHRPEDSQDRQEPRPHHLGPAALHRPPPSPCAIGLACVISRSSMGAETENRPTTPLPPRTLPVHPLCAASYFWKSLPFI